MDIKELDYQIQHRLGRKLSEKQVIFLAKTCDLDKALRIAMTYDKEQMTIKPYLFDF